MIGRNDDAVQMLEAASKSCNLVPQGPASVVSRGVARVQLGEALSRKET